MLLTCPGQGTTLGSISSMVHGHHQRRPLCLGLDKEEYHTSCPTVVNTRCSTRCSLRQPRSPPRSRFPRMSWEVNRPCLLPRRRCLPRCRCLPRRLCLPALGPNLQAPTGDIRVPQALRMDTWVLNITMILVLHGKLEKLEKPTGPSLPSVTNSLRITTSSSIPRRNRRSIIPRVVREGLLRCRRGPSQMITTQIAALTVMTRRLHQKTTVRSRASLRSKTLKR